MIPLTDKEMQDMADVSKAVADYSRIDYEGIQKAVKEMREAMPTAAQAHERMVAGMKEINQGGW